MTDQAQDKLVELTGALKKQRGEPGVQTALGKAEAKDLWQ